jgi:hypothetical protein
MSFDNAYFTSTYYVIVAEHQARIRESMRGSSPRKQRASRLRRPPHAID